MLCPLPESADWCKKRQVLETRARHGGGRSAQQHAAMRQPTAHTGPASPTPCLVAAAAGVLGSWRRFGGGQRRRDQMRAAAAAARPSACVWATSATVSGGALHWSGDRLQGAVDWASAIAARGTRLDCAASKNYPAMASFVAAAAGVRGSWRRFGCG